MSEVLTYALIITLDVLAAAAVVFVTAKLKRGGIVGAIAGLVVEGVRLLCAMGITKAGVVADSEIFGWLVNLRVYNIPILIGLGFFGGSVGAPQANLKSATCPKCSAKLTLDPAAMQASANADLTNRRCAFSCPKCGVGLVADVDTFSVAEAPQPNLGGSQASTEVAPETERPNS